MITARASLGFSSRKSPRPVLTIDSTKPAMPGFPSFVFVWPSNCGSRSFTEMTAVRPSRTSSPERLSSLSLSRAWSRAYLFKVRVSADRKPDMWLPPSRVLMLLANEWIDSWYEEFHCIATSTAPSSVSPAKKITFRWTVSLFSFR